MLAFRTFPFVLAGMWITAAVKAFQLGDVANGCYFVSGAFVCEVVGLYATPLRAA